MKRYLTTLLIALHFCAFGQNFDELMEKRQLSCSDVSYNSTKLFEEYYQNNDIDLAKKLLNSTGKRNARFQNLYSGQKY